MKAPLLDPTTFYQCDRCTACCRWPGDVRITDEEVTKIASFFDLTEQEFIDQHTRVNSARNGLSILENEDHSCSMLVNGGCLIHEAKPEQCKGFPNTWNFPGWKDVCHAKPIPIDLAKEQGLLE